MLAPIPMALSCTRPCNPFRAEPFVSSLAAQEALMRVLTPIQMARVFMGCYPYNPGKAVC